tara:strand:+ start:131 stop:388 length:258 start_codon:yes stop_codon:yes gene_type:complete
MLAHTTVHYVGYALESATREWNMRWPPIQALARSRLSPLARFLRIFMRLVGGSNNVGTFSLSLQPTKSHFEQGEKAEKFGWLARR